MEPETPSRRPQPRPLHFERPKHLVRRDRGDLVEPLAFHAALAPSELAREVIEVREPSLIGSAEGAIARLLLTIPAGAVANAATAERYRELLAVLPSETHFVVVTHERVQAEVASWTEAAALESRLTLLPIRDHVNFTDWAQDPYVVVGSPEGTSFIEPFSFLRFADSLIAEVVARGAGLGVSQAPLYFQGGSILIGDDFFFVGGDYPRRTLDYIPDVIAPPSGESDEALVARLFQETFDSRRKMIVIESEVQVPQAELALRQDEQGFWVDEIYVSNAPGTTQPIFHIDMFISLAGRGDDGTYRVLVGDPGLAAGSLGVPPWGHAMQDAFDSIAEQLKARPGFSVYRNPLPLAYWHEDVPRRYFADRDRAIFDTLSEQGVETVPLFHWYFATANNALVEVTDARSRVWLPTYGHGSWSDLSTTDRENHRIWQCLGFTPQLLGDFHPFAALLGAVHCISKYLGRRS